MDEQKFMQTAHALESLDSVLKSLKQAIEVKKYAVGQQRQSYKQNLAQKNSQLEALKQAASETLLKVGSAVEKIDMVLKEDGSSNNND